MIDLQRPIEFPWYFSWLGWVVSAFILAPSPLYICLDGCLTQSFIFSLPSFILYSILYSPFLILFTGDALGSSQILWWHVIFMAPFLVFFVPLKHFFDRKFERFAWKIVVWILKYLILLVIFVSYMWALNMIWTAIPMGTTQMWLGQLP